MCWACAGPIPLPAEHSHAFGAGTCRYVKDLLGLSYLAHTDAASADRLLAPVRAAAPASVSLTGDPRIHLELSHLGDDTVVQLVNFTCFGESPAPFKTTPAPCVVSLLIPAGKQVTAATLSSPDAPSAARVPVPWKVVDGRATIDVTVSQYSVLVVTMA